EQQRRMIGTLSLVAVSRLPLAQILLLDHRADQKYQMLFTQHVPHMHRQQRRLLRTVLVKGHRISPLPPFCTISRRFTISKTISCDTNSSEVRSCRDASANHSILDDSPRPRGKAGLSPQLLPMPDAGRIVEDAVAGLVGQHQNLAAMMRLVREHVSEHGPSGGPRSCPTAARELRNAAIRSGRESIRQHPQAL